MTITFLVERNKQIYDKVNKNLFSLIFRDRK